MVEHLIYEEGNAGFDKVLVYVLIREKMKEHPLELKGIISPKRMKTLLEGVKHGVQSLFPFFRKMIFTAWPLLLCMALCAAYMFYLKKTSLEVSAIEGGRKLAEVSLFSPKIDDVLKAFNGDSSRYVYPGGAAALLGLFSVCLWLVSLVKRKI